MKKSKALKIYEDVFGEVVDWLPVERKKEIEYFMSQIAWGNPQRGKPPKGSKIAAENFLKDYPPDEREKLRRRIFRRWHGSGIMGLPSEER